MKLYVIRHGQSEGNLRGVYTGWADMPLTEKGIQDAKNVASLLAKVSFDQVFSSDLIRSKQTAEQAIPGCGYEENDLLREINVGSVSGKALATITPEMRQDMVVNGFAVYGGESRKTFNDRIRAFMRQMEGLNAQTVAAFSHGGWLRGMLDEVVGVTLPRKAVCCENCTVAVFEYDGQTWKLHSWINPM